MRTGMRSEHHKYWLLVLVPLLILAVLFPFMSKAASNLYGWIIVQAFSWQRVFNRQLVTLFSQYTAHHSFTVAFSLISLSFIYGVVHAIGPGHGKAVIASYLTTQRSKVTQGICLSMLGALLQSITAIVVVTVLMLVFGWFATRVMGSTRYLEAASFILVIMLGLVVIIRSTLKLWRLIKTRSARATRHPLAPINAQSTSAIQVPLSDTLFTPVSDTSLLLSHSHACDCHCAHHVDPARITGGVKESVLAVMAIGLRPCTGALLVLSAASLLGQWLIGTIAVLFMGIGTGITISTIAVVCVFARKVIVRLTRRQHNPRMIELGQFTVLGLSCIGGIVICLLGATLLSGIVIHPASGFSFGS